MGANIVSMVWKRLKASASPLARLLLVCLVVLLFLSVLRASLFSDVSEDKRVWFELSFLLLAAISAELLVVFLKQPFVMVLLLVGVAVSPSVIGLVSSLLGVGVPNVVSSEGIVRIFAQLGAILLLFKVGLHSETKDIFNAKNFVVAFLGVLVPFTAGFLYAWLSGHGVGYALFLGAALTATSVGVTVAVLHELKLLDKPFAKVILGAAVIDDVLALLVLSLVKNTPSSFSLNEFYPFALVVGTAIVFVAGGILLGKEIVRRYLDREVVSQTVFLGSLVFVLAYAYVAEYIGLSAIVGAFIAGVSLNFSRATSKLFELFYPLEAFFTPVFFISLGMLVDVNALAANLVPIAVVTILAILSKVVACGIAARATGSPPGDSLVVGVGMVPRGEIALIIGLYGLTAVGAGGLPVLGAVEYSTIAAMAFLTTLVAPPLLQRSLKRL